MHKWQILYEEVYAGEKTTIYLGDMWADTMSEAIQKASEYWEVPRDGVVAVQIVPERR